MQYIRARLSLMMFLHYFSAGSVLPLLSLYLGRYLGFSGAQIGSVMAMSAVAAFVSPMVGAALVDKIMPAERLLSLFQFASAGVMLMLAFQTTFRGVLVSYLAYMLLFGPCVGLTNAITFHHTPDKARGFGTVRLWGTMGWIGAAWFFGFFSVHGLRAALFFSAGAGVLHGFYALSLPISTRGGRKKLFERRALALFVTPRVAALCAMSLLIRMTNQYYYFGTAPFLSFLGVHEGLIMPIMSIGQITEVVFLGLLGMFLPRFGYRKILLLGIASEGCRFGLFFAGGYLGTPVAGVLGILFHGPSFAFFSATAFILMDSFCDLRSRSGAHQFFEMVTHGVGSFLGFQAAGLFFDLFAAPPAAEAGYASFWLVPLIITGGAFIIALFFGRAENNQDGTLRNGTP